MQLTVTHSDNGQASCDHAVGLCLKKPEALPLAVHICRVQVEAAHLVFALEQHLSVANGVSVPNVPEVLNSLQPNSGPQHMQRERAPSFGASRVIVLGQAMDDCKWMASTQFQNVITVHALRTRAACSVNSHFAA